MNDVDWEGVHPEKKPNKQVRYKQKFCKWHAHGLPVVLKVIKHLHSTKTPINESYKKLLNTFSKSTEMSEQS